jgi:hypothetical protein
MPWRLRPKRSARTGIAEVALERSGFVKWALLWPVAWIGYILVYGRITSRPKIAIPMGLALAWLGYALWSEAAP